MPERATYSVRLDEFLFVTPVLPGEDMRLTSYESNNQDSDYLLNGLSVGSSIASYADTNQDDEFQLKGQSGAGGTLDVNATGTVTAAGDIAGTDRRLAQQFTPQASGQLSEFKFTLGANNGTPTGNTTWEIRADNSDNPTGSVLDSGTITLTQNTENTVTVTDGPFLDGATKYWLLLAPAAQATNTYYTWATATTDVYASHVAKYSDNAGTTWTDINAIGAGRQDLNFEVTTSAVTSYDLLAQSFQVTGAQTVGTVDLWLKKVGSPTGNLTVEIQPDSAGAPSGTAVSNGTSGTVAASTLTTSYADITFSFATPPSLSGSTTYWLVLKTTDSASNTNYVQWGADTSTPGYADGSMSGEASATWSALSADAVFEVKQPGVYAKLAQSFKIDSTQTVDKVKLWMKKVGSPTGTMTLRIETSTGVQPTGTLADANATVTVSESSLTTDYGYILFDFGTNFELTGNTSYWLVLSTDRSQSNVNYVVWGGDSSSPSYSNGEMVGEL